LGFILTIMKKEVADLKVSVTLKKLNRTIFKITPTHQSQYHSFDSVIILYYCGNNSYFLSHKGHGYYSAACKDNFMTITRVKRRKISTVFFMAFCWAAIGCQVAEDGADADESLGETSDDITIAKLRIINATTDKAALAPDGSELTLVDGMTIDLAALGGAVTIEATGTGRGSVVFRLNGSFIRKESSAPYTLDGDSTKADPQKPGANITDYKSGLLDKPGSYTLSVESSGKNIQVRFLITANGTPGTKPTPTPPSTSPSPSSNDLVVLKTVTFENNSIGARTESNQGARAYLDSMLKSDFSAGTRFENNHASIVWDPLGAGKVLQATYATKQYGGSSGTQWKYDLGGQYADVYVSYRVRFHQEGNQSFDFVRGGKLPGLCGGAGFNESGNCPTGCTSAPLGFSARSMWRSEGELVQYLYYPDKKEPCGDDFGYTQNNQPLMAQSGRWYTVRHHVRMNDVGSANGLIEAWVDGAQVLSKKDMVWRKDARVFVNTFYFSTFFGGNSSVWAPTSKDEKIQFDDIVISKPR